MPLTGKNVTRTGSTALHSKLISVKHSQEKNVYKLVEIQTDDTAALQSFLDNAGTSLAGFRYFDKRPLSIIENHLCTYLIVNKKQAVCYGHLDKEDDTVWLGIAVIEGQTGQGLGKKMMQHLMDKAKALKLPAIQLAVDTDNIPAQYLYKKFGFNIIKKTEKYILMSCRVEELSS